MTDVRTGRALTIVVPNEIVSENVILNRYRKPIHRTAFRRRLKKGFIKSINANLWTTIADGNLWNGVFVNLPGHVGSKRRRVEILSWRARFLDKDNLYGGAKILIDALRDVGLIFRDSPKWVDVNVYQKIDGKNRRTEIRIAEII